MIYSWKDGEAQDVKVSHVLPPILCLNRCEGQKVLMYGVGRKLFFPIHHGLWRF